MAPTAAVVYFLAFAFAVSNVDSTTTRYASARVESCGGCQLNRHAAIKQFINEDVPQYADVEFKHIQGAIPELVLFDENNAEVKRLHLAGLTREECNDLLLSNGFVKKPAKDEI